MLELIVGFYLFVCGCYDLTFGKNGYFVYLFVQSIAFFIAGVGYVGTFVPNSQPCTLPRIISRIHFPTSLLLQSMKDENIFFPSELFDQAIPVSDYLQTRSFFCDERWFKLSYFFVDNILGKQKDESALSAGTECCIFIGIIR